MKLIDKVLIGITGVGAVALTAQHIRNRNSEPSVYMCPWCKGEHQMTDMEFAVHVVDMRRQYG